MKLDGPGAELEQRGGLQLHVPDEPHDQGVVPQAQVGQASDEHQAVGQSCQLVVVEMENPESRESRERLGQLPEVVVAQRQGLEVLELTNLRWEAVQLISSKI